MFYDPKTIEEKWQKKWAEQNLYKAEDFSGKPPHLDRRLLRQHWCNRALNTHTKNFDVSVNPVASENPAAETATCLHKYGHSRCGGKEKKYILIEFPYPSGAGLHVGHVRSYTALDVFCRKLRMQGKNVLYPIGWDAFGLPTENYAIKNKIHPRIATEQNICTFTKQIKSLGISFDWSREINTTDPPYYKWTQWIFLKLYENGLAYKANIPINWCPMCKIGLANEEVVNGKCERCGVITEKRQKEQWMLAITKYADRLIDDLETVDYLEKIKSQQINWIGRSEGANVKFSVILRSDEGATKNPVVNTRSFANAQDDAILEVFTTRPDTLFGCTYMVVCPEHPLIRNWKLEIRNWEEVEEYIKKSQAKSELERTENKEKTGVEIKGLKAVNPVNNEKISIFVADYVLSGYGTGAIMAVPAHDERDFEFAKKYGLAIREVVAPKNSNTKTPSNEEAFDDREDSCPRREIWNCHLDNSINDNKNNVKSQNGAETAEGFEPSDLGMTIPDPHHAAGTNTPNSLYQKNNAISNNFFSGEGISVNSEFLNGLPTKEAKEKMIEWLEENGAGKREVQYKLRDWVFSRQRYWGEPIPLVHCEKCKKLVENFKTPLNPPLVRGEASETVEIGNLEFSNGELLNPGWIVIPEKQLPLTLPNVESYEPTETGESPLANITDWVNTTCPKCGGPAKRETDTMPNWAGSSWYFLRYIDPKNENKLADPEKLKYWMPVDLYNGGMEHTTLHLLYSRFWNKFLYDIGVVPTSEPYARRVSHGMILAEDGKKMSKSLGNVINPDDVVRKFGADALRVYEMFMGPYGESIPWSADGLKGVRRFLDRVWGMGCRIMNYEFPPEALRPPMAGDQPLAERIMNGEKVDIDVEQVNADVETRFIASENTEKIKSLLHKTIKKVTEDIDNFKFNTAISAMMILANELEREEVIDAEDYKSLLLILSPFAPHMCEEIWEKIQVKSQKSKVKNYGSIFTHPWPAYNPELAKDAEIELVVQINGKVRDKFTASADISEEDAKKQALESEKVKERIKGKKVVKVIFVPAKLINIVVK